MIRLLMLLLVFLLPTDAIAEQKEVTPFASQFKTRIPYYNRLSTRVATAGNLDYESISELNYKNFDLIIDFRLENEGAIEERLMASRLDVPYENVQVHPARTISDAQLSLFIDVFESEDGMILMHCEDGSRTGAMWARYLIHRGVDRETAFEEGRTIGMTAELEKKILIQLNRIREH